jgi:hypothetical protein
MCIFTPGVSGRRRYIGKERGEFTKTVWGRGARVGQGVETLGNLIHIYDSLLAYTDGLMW